MAPFKFPCSSHRRRATLHHRSPDRPVGAVSHRDGPGQGGGTNEFREKRWRPWVSFRMLRRRCVGGPELSASARGDPASSQLDWGPFRGARGF